MLRSEDFSTAVRLGARSGTRRLVLHYSAGDPGVTNPAIVGVVVPGKQVPRAAHRNRIQRRVRALMRERVRRLAPGDRLVVRGLAGADGATSAELARDLDRCLDRCLEAGGRRRPSSTVTRCPR